MDENPTIRDFAFSSTHRGTRSHRSRRLLLVIGLILVAFLVGMPFPAWGMETYAIRDALENDGAPGDRFGHAVDISGDVAVVAAPGTCALGAPGAVYVYRRYGQAWNLSEKVSPTTSGDCAFGMAIALAGDTLVIGSKNGLNGIISLLRLDTGVRQRIDLGANGGSQVSGLSASPTTIAIGLPLAPHGDEPFADSGKVVMMERDGDLWKQGVELSPGCKETRCYFGIGVSIHQDTLACTSSRGDKVSMFLRKDGLWELEGTVSPHGIWPRVAVWGDTVLFSDQSNGGTGIIKPGSHTVHVLQKEAGGWTSTFALQHPDLDHASGFGFGMAIEEDVVLIGAFGESTYSGAVYVFHRTGNTWQRLSRSVVPGLDGGRLGESLALSGDDGVVGAPGIAEGQQDRGSAYILERGTLLTLGDPCTIGGYCPMGYCVDGFCCDTPCEGVCEACSRGKKGQGENGECGPVAAGTDPDDDCPEHAGYPVSCLADGLCDGLGACRQFAVETTPCGASTCNSGVVYGSLCDGFGTCIEDSLASCMPYICGETACLTACTGDQDCVEGATCSEAGTCLSGAVCDGEYAAISPSGWQDCSPYRCRPNGTCAISCSGIEDCKEPYVCDRSRRCILLNSSDSCPWGCSVLGSASQSQRRYFIGWLIGIVGLGWIYIRFCRPKNGRFGR